ARPAARDSLPAARARMALRHRERPRDPSGDLSELLSAGRERAVGRPGEHAEHVSLSAGARDGGLSHEVAAPALRAPAALEPEGYPGREASRARPPTLV